MKFEITGEWGNSSELDGLLYCAQRIEEMLMRYTSHLYKVPVYNSFMLIAEYLNVYDQVQKGIIDQSHLGNILDEFLDSFSNDIVIKDKYSASEIQYFISQLKGNSRPEQRKMLHYLYHSLSDYPKRCATVLTKTVRKPNDKKKIENVLKSYLSMISGMGYSSDYIYKFCKQIFTCSNITEVNYIEKFISRFDRAEQQYVVYFAIDKNLSVFREILESRLGVSFQRDEYYSRFKYDDQKFICVNISVTALDPSCAARRAFEIFEFFMQFYRFLGNRDFHWCYKISQIRDSDGNLEYWPFRPNIYYYSKDYDDTTLGKNSEHIINKLIENAAGNDIYNIKKIIRTHNTALSSHDTGNAFLNFWSILEMIGVSDRTDTKIREIMRSIIPILKRNYVKRVVEELRDYLKANLTIEDYTSLMNNIDSDYDDICKIAFLIACPESESDRKNLYQKLRNYPLIRSRISQLYEDVFKDKKKFMMELDRYERRLEWHIQRLYRVRNSIIHAGDRDDNVETLVGHLHSYVDETAMDIINRLVQENSVGSISNAIVDAQIFLGNFYKEEKSNAFSKEDVRKLLG